MVVCKRRRAGMYVKELYPDKVEFAGMIANGLDFWRQRQVCDPSTLGLVMDSI